LSSGGEHTTQQLWAKDPSLSGDSLVSSAIEKGVSRLIVVGCDLEDSILATDFVAGRPNCWASVGIHPHEAKHYVGNDMLKKRFTELVKEDKVTAVGECGLDYYYNHSPKADQIELLRFQIELALTNDLPIIFHVREAFDDFWDVFNDYKGIRGVLHSFTDNAANLSIALSHGLFIGVNGIATFTKVDAQREVYRSVPLENMLLETDAPFLAPNHTEVVLTSRPMLLIRPSSWLS